MKYTIDEIIAFVRSAGVKAKGITGDSSLGGDLNIWSDDLDELLSDYAQAFDVDMSTYLWYFHSKEEGFNIGALFFKPPNKRVAHIPITIDMLKEFSETGEWAVKYPDHDLPKYRLDIAINFSIFIFVTIILLVSLVSLVKGCSGR